ncbi:MAG: hypothetical protein GY906_39665 [bacterium]|nr:hypothetical protein [bacterium]
MKSRIFSILLLAVACGCASAPKINYFTLGMESSGKVDTSANLTVERLRVSDALDRSEIVISSAATRVEFYAREHWAGGLGELVQQKLAAEFGPVVEDRRNLVVSGTVLACEQVDRAGTNSARLMLRVAIRDAEKKRFEAPLLDKTYSVQKPLTKADPEIVVEALAECAVDIAVEIAADVSLFSSNH